jgi:hypothetical protein
MLSSYSLSDVSHFCAPISSWLAPANCCRKQTEHSISAWEGAASQGEVLLPFLLCQLLASSPPSSKAGGRGERGRTPQYNYQQGGEEESKGAREEEGGIHFDIEMRPLADSGSFCDAVGGVELVRVCWVSGRGGTH